MTASAPQQEALPNQAEPSRSEHPESGSGHREHDVPDNSPALPSGGLAEDVPGADDQLEDEELLAIAALKEQVRAAVFALSTIEDELAAIQASRGDFLRRWSYPVSEASGGIEEFSYLDPVPEWLRIQGAAAQATCHRLAYVYAARAIASSLDEQSARNLGTDLCVLGRLYCMAANGWNFGGRDRMLFDDLATGNVAALSRAFEGEHSRLDRTKTTTVTTFILDLADQATIARQWRRYAGSAADLPLRASDLPTGFRPESMSDFGLGTVAFRKSGALGRVTRVFCHAFALGDWLEAQGAAHRVFGQHEQDEQHRGMNDGMRGIRGFTTKFDSSIGDFSHAEDGKIGGTHVLSAAVRLGNIVLDWGSLGMGREESLGLLVRYLSRLPMAPQSVITGSQSLQQPRAPIWMLTLTELDLPKGFSLRQEKSDEMTCDRLFQQPATDRYSPTLALTVGFTSDAEQGRLVFDRLVAARTALRDAWQIRDAGTTVPFAEDCDVVAQRHTVEGRDGAWIAVRAGRLTFRVSTDGVRLDPTIALARLQLQKVVGIMTPVGLRRL